MKTSKAYKAAWDSEFAKLSDADRAKVLASPDGKLSAELAAKAESESPKFWKHYYDNEVLNRFANTVWNGRVFGEQTMLQMMAECCDEQQFLKAVEDAL